MTEQSVLETLRRVPDRIILATMGRDLDLYDNSACLCGWFVREKLAEIQNRGASTVSLPRIQTFWGDSPRSTREMSVEMFGGTALEWRDIHTGVTEDETVGVVERAFVRRVDEAVNPRKRRAS